jgi:5-methylcytosine-specific restriction endonuclease McrA
MPIDYKKYPKNWKMIRQEIIWRSNDRCELCNAENYMPHWKTNSKVVLTVHHINFNPQDNRMCNLIALCQRCHIKLDAGEKARRRALKKNGGLKLL